MSRVALWLLVQNDTNVINGQRRAYMATRCSCPVSALGYLSSVCNNVSEVSYPTSLAEPSNLVGIGGLDPMNHDTEAVLLSNLALEFRAVDIPCQDRTSCNNAIECPPTPDL